MQKLKKTITVLVLGSWLVCTLTLARTWFQAVL